MSIKAIHLKNGQGVSYKDGVWIVVSNEKVAKGNWRSSQVLTLRNAKTGQLIEERFRTDEEFEQVITTRKTLSYLYSTGDAHVFMDMETFEEVHVPEELVGAASVYLQPQLEVTVAFVEGAPLSVELPFSVELVVEDTPPNLRGATATNQLKDAVCEGGAKVKVPPFIENGQRIKVDTRSGEYMGKV